MQIIARTFKFMFLHALPIVFIYENICLPRQARTPRCIFRTSTRRNLTRRRLLDAKLDVSKRGSQTQNHGFLTSKGPLEAQSSEVWTNLKLRKLAVCCKLFPAVVGDQKSRVNTCVSRHLSACSKTRLKLRKLRTDFRKTGRAPRCRERGNSRCP